MGVIRSFQWAIQWKSPLDYVYYLIIFFNWISYKSSLYLKRLLVNFYRRHFYSQPILKYNTAFLFRDGDRGRPHPVSVLSKAGPVPSLSVLERKTSLSVLKLPKVFLSVLKRSQPSLSVFKQAKASSRVLKRRTYDVQWSLRTLKDA